jgi:lipopolysaccharide transport system permease protein
MDTPDSHPTNPHSNWDRIYSPKSVLANPGSLARDMFTDLLNARELAWRLFLRNISAAYRRTFLGYIWAFLPPVFTTLTFLFLQKQKVLTLDSGDLPYVVFVLSGTLLWQTFFEALNAPLKMANQSKVMLAKINFPREALILAGIAEVVFNLWIRMLLLVPVLLYFGCMPDLQWLAALFGVFSLILVGTTLGVLILPFGILYEDVEKGLPMIATIWMFLTPVVYALPTEGAARWLLFLNPASAPIVQTRDWLTGQASGAEGTLFLITGIFLACSFLGWLLYRVSLPHLIARLPS